MTFGLAVIADDFTGGLMVADLIERQDVRVAVVTDVAALRTLGDRDVVVIVTRLRLMPKADVLSALTAITDALDAIGTRQIYYKFCATFDSTDDGNIGPCGEYLADRYHCDRLFFGPAVPDLAVFVHEGHMFYRGRLLSESSKRFDPVTPMTDSDLVRVLQRQTDRTVGLLPHRILHRGPDAAAAWLEAETRRGVRFFVLDAVDNDDVRCAAVLARDAPVVTGGDALAVELAKQLAGASVRKSGDETCSSRPALQGGAVVLVGSCAQVTLDQLSHFEADHAVFHIDLGNAGNADEVIAAALSWAEPRLPSRPIAFSTAGLPDAVAELQRRLGVTVAAKRAEHSLAGIAAGLFAKGVRRFVVAGGETSGAVVEALGVTHLQAVPSGDMGSGLCLALAPEPVWLFLKSGKLGVVDLFSRAFTVMDR